MSKAWGFAGLVVIGIIVADLVIHPVGVTALGHQGNSALGTTSSALLGGRPTH